MYREKDYNRGRESAAHTNADGVGRQKRPTVAKGNSVFDTATPKTKRSFHFGDDQEPPRKRRRHRLRRFKKPLTVIVVLLLLLMPPWLYLTAGLNSHPLPRSKEALGIDGSGRIGVTNIAFFGVDTRGDDDVGRSDAMMIISVDIFHGTMKMISLLRDSKVPIEGHGETKLNHAYAYGGPELAVKTINQVYHTDIREFATVNFNQLSGIVDAVGGVEMDVSEAERTALNSLLHDQFPDSPPLESSGHVVLDGHQAISFSRVRKIDSDNARTDRQQEVLNAIFTSFKGMRPWEYPRFIHHFSNSVDTSLSSFDMLKLAPLMIRDFEPERYTVPDIAYETDLKGHKDSDGIWYWHYDLDRAADRIRTIIYGQ